MKLEPESSTIEYKAQEPNKNQVVKTAVAFANSFGGRLVIGVADTGEVVGLPETTASELMERLPRAIYDQTVPPLLPIAFSQRYGEKLVVILEISRSLYAPHYVRSDGKQHGTYIRVGSTTATASFDFITELERRSRGVYFDESAVLRASLKDLDEKKILAFLKGRVLGFSGTVTEKLLESYKIIVEHENHHYPSVAGILCFGYEPQRYFSEAMILANYFEGTKGRDSKRSVDCNGTLFEQFDRALGFFKDVLASQYSIIGEKRSEDLEIPLVALREALVNALVHRSYNQSAPAKLSIFADRVELWTPGGFPGPLNTNQLRDGVTFIRNPAICKIFREAKLMEKLGSGFIQIFDSIEKAKLKEPVIVDGGIYIKYILSREKSSQHKDSDFEIMEKIYQQFGEISVSEVMKRMGVSRVTASRYLSKLRKQGKIHGKGRGPAIRYFLGRE